MRVRGHGIDGGVLGAPSIFGTLYSGGAQLVVGVCGEKDCAPSNLGVETIGCLARADGGGDGVRDQKLVPAFAFSDDNHFGCKLDAVGGASSAVFFNVSLHDMDKLHRGDVYKGYSTTERFDYANAGAPFDAELLPRVTRVEPSAGSLAGGADLTIYGHGFGSEATNLDVTVGDGTARCSISEITPESVRCRVQWISSAVDVQMPFNKPEQARVDQDLASYPAERGARFQWLDDGPAAAVGSRTALRHPPAKAPQATAAA